MIRTKVKERKNEIVKKVRGKSGITLIALVITIVLNASAWS